MAVAAAIALATTAYGVYNSETQKAEAKRGLARQKFNNYSATPEMQSAFSRAQAMSQFGFSPQERAAYRQNKAQDINTQAQRALDIGGGNMARTISKLGQISNLQSENQFAIQDAQLKRQNIRYADSLASQLQGQKNMATGAGINQYNQAQQAYGNAYAQNQTNENQLISQVPYIVDSMGDGNWTGNMRKGINKTPPTDPSNPTAFNNYYNAYQLGYG